MSIRLIAALLLALTTLAACQSTGSAPGDPQVQRGGY